MPGHSLTERNVLTEDELTGVRGEACAQEKQKKNMCAGLRSQTVTVCYFRVTVCTATGVATLVHNRLARVCSRTLREGSVGVANEDSSPFTRISRFRLPPYKQIASLGCSVHLIFLALLR